MNPKPFLKVALLILMLAHGSDAFFFDKFRKLAGHKPKHKSLEISPSPAPASAGVVKSGNGTQNSGIGAAPVPEASVIKEIEDYKCSISPKPCHDRQNLTACIQFSQTAPKEVFLIVKNDGDSPLKVNITISPVNITFQDMQIPRHQAKKVNISANVEGGPSITSNAGNGECVIYMGSPVSVGNIFDRFPSYATYMTPIYGAYLLFLTALIIGGTWACCKLAKRERHVDGVPYQELEMGHPDSLSANNVETADGWDEGWDDDWDEIREVKSPNGRHMANVSANGLASRSSDRDGWGNDWDD